MSHKERIALEIDELLKDVHGGEWRPNAIVAPMLMKSLLTDVAALKAKVDALDTKVPNVQKQLARLNLLLAKANKSKTLNHVDFLVYIANALIDIQEIVGWYFKNKNSLKEEKHNG